MPFSSIIIPVKNFERTIEKTFEYLLNVDCSHDSWEIIIADGGSTDRTVEIINSWTKRHPFIKLVEAPNSPSPAYARNRALEVAKGDFLFFTDADCAPCRDWMKEILRQFERDSKISAVGGEVFTLKVDPNNLVEAWCQHFRFNMVSPRYGFIKEGYFPDFPKHPRPSDIGGHKAYFFGTCNVAYRTSAIRELGSKFWDRPTGEDMDFSFQHRKNGWKFYFAPKARVDHMHRADLKSLRRVWVSYGQAHPPLIDKYVKIRRLEIILQFLQSKPSFMIPFPLKGFIYWGNFHMAHLSGLLFMLGLIFSWGLFSWLFFMPFLFFTFQYFKWNFSMEPRSKFFTWCKMKYLTNLSFIKGGLKGCLKHKVLCIEPSF
ncbi:MAG: glycosyltransferase [Candidatus Omnitrophota bacterium]|jgi:glycosyltransferase involved in cell wall biosynthesis